MGLKLIANDADDLQVVSSALQDAILRVGDIHYDRASRSLTLGASRFRHEARKSERVQCGLRLDGVESVRTRALDTTRRDAFAVLLNLSFEMADDPAGTVVMTFAGGGEMAVAVEGLDLILSDVGEGRRTRSVPSHEDA
ncbi:MAG: DUF2948 family protein [Litorimonas sp.]